MNIAKPGSPNAERYARDIDYYTEYNARPEEKARQAERHATGFFTDRRATEPSGIYLGVIKLEDGRFIIKIGESYAVRNRAGMIATSARTHGLDTEWAEILWIVDIEDDAERAIAEDNIKRLLGQFFEPYVGTEYFPIEAYYLIQPLFAEDGRPFDVRSTYPERKAEFDAYLTEVVTRW